MVFFEEEDIFFKIFYYAFEVITWGWIAEILFAIVVIVLLLYLAIIIKEHRVIKFVFKDKWYFLKSFLYFYLMEKINFIKHYLAIVKFNVAEWSPYFIAIMSIAVILIGFFIIFGIRLLTELGQNRAQTLGA